MHYEQKNSISIVKISFKCHKIEAETMVLYVLLINNNSIFFFKISWLCPNVLPS